MTSRLESWFTPTVTIALVVETGVPKMDPLTLAVLLSDFWRMWVVVEPLVMISLKSIILVRCAPFSLNSSWITPVGAGPQTSVRRFKSTVQLWLKEVVGSSVLVSRFRTRSCVVAPVNEVAGIA